MFKVKSKLELSLYVFIALLGIVYVYNAWSPSCYGVFLQQIQAQDLGIIWGTPRAIRSDEWAVITPLTQALTHNDFSQFNTTSLYNENLRINYGLPIFDWGLLFKPTMWGYLILSPAYAYSLHWYLIFVIFIVGYFKLFHVIGIEKKMAFLLALVIYFSGYSQFWWNEKGPVFAFFPWVFLILFSEFPKNLFIKLILFYWFTASWFITNFYPPFILSLAFVGGLLFIRNGHYWFKWQRLILLLLTALLAAGTLVCYLWDYLIQTASTVYPGARHSSGGSVPFREMLSQLQPFLMYDVDFNTPFKNICEIGNVGLPFIMMAIFHLDFKSVTKLKFDKSVSILILGVCLMFAWMLLPMPSLVGKLFLWDHVQPERMAFAEGILIAILFGLLANKFTYVFSIERFVSYSLFIIAIWYLATEPYLGFRFSGMLDLCFIPALFVAYLCVKYLRFSAFLSFVLVSVALLGIVNMRFNPIQSSKAIFEQEFGIKNELNKYVDSQGILAVPGFMGATLNGLGYKSVTHVTAMPNLDFWKKRYPNMSDEQFNQVFNRYSHIILDNNVAEPQSPVPDQVRIPLKDFYY